MPFSDTQIKALATKLSPKFVRTREERGVTLSYIEGWHAVSEANRIFGYDGWDREMVSSDCIWQGRSNGLAAASYVNIGLKPGQYVGVKRHQLRSDMTRAPIGALVISCGGC